MVGKDGRAANLIEITSDHINPLSGGMKARGGNTAFMKAWKTANGGKTIRYIDISGQNCEISSA